jgi:hypothetical protein
MDGCFKLVFQHSFGMSNFVSHLLIVQCGQVGVRQRVIAKV